MNTQTLIATAQALVADHKGLLAMDESPTTCNKRFAAHGITQSAPTRLAYRELIATTPWLSECISGAILSDETIRQHTSHGMPIAQALIKSGIIPGIKVDTGATDLAGHPGEKITEGLDGLRARLTEHGKLGARFAKWRAVIVIGDAIPSAGCIHANAHALARYAALCQEAEIVPIVEPEVLMDGEHTLDRCRATTEEVLQVVFEHLRRYRVLLEGMVLKPNMVLPGLRCPDQASATEIARVTVQCLLRTVPAAVPGIALLSGGQSPAQASERLNQMHALFDPHLPWALTFSFARAIQAPALAVWKGDPLNAAAAQQALLHRSRCNGAACRAEYSALMEQC